ncbi:universal stress protein [Paractinoplanes durhamensis]|uniref:UspA domain-containing protein n=1 Tax=Paractinoplanes durhamensis TaxID=113563 RepID=A0ABQ3YRV0_9ACTN|nr:universal stress protein [Actinoplanes durhamensis]GIE00234.1 hypothetical protein Adu01nite_15840 [Actinoplanes durhamensis]
MRTRTVVVGTDGADPGMVAVAWAAREAQRRDATLRIVHSIDWNWRDSDASFAGEYAEQVWSSARAVTDTAARHAGKIAPDLRIEQHTFIDRPAEQLLEAGKSAELIVLGGHDRRGISWLSPGSVGHRVAVHATCSVVVTRGRADGRGAVLAGIDDSPYAEQVAEAAFAAANSRECNLVALRSLVPTAPPWTGGIRAHGVPIPEEDDAERARVEELLAPWRDKYPGVPVGVTIAHGSAATALAAASAHARLVVVGNRGHGIVRGTLLGSTGLQLLHHAHCPVLIARRGSHPSG